MKFPIGGIVREPRSGRIWCDSKTDSIVWMEEDTMELPPRSLCCVDQKALTLLDRPSGLYHIQEVLLWQRKTENSIP